MIGTQGILEQEVDDLYTPIEYAQEEMMRRWNDKVLRNKVRDFLKGDIPDVLQESPRAVISRHVMSPNFELLDFLRVAREHALHPIGLEYLHDKFVTKNEDKYYLGKMVFYEGVGKKGGRKLSSVQVVDFNLCDGKHIVDLETISGTGFIEFHHVLVDSFLHPDERVDMSEYYRRNGIQASRYYKYILALFTCHGVLFESFLTQGFYQDLTRDILLPCFREMTSLFGVKPLIVRLAPKESENDIYWRYYPDTLKAKVSDIL